MKLEDILENKYGNSIAYNVNGNSVSYNELIEKSRMYSEFLARQGKEPVIVYGHKSVGMIISFFACIFSHRTYIPVEKGTPYLRIEKIAELSGASLLIANENIDFNKTESLKLEELKKYKNASVKNDENNETVYIIFTSGSGGEPKGVPVSRKNLESFIEWISGLSPLRGYSSVGVLNTASFSFDLSVADMFYSLYNGHSLICVEKNDVSDYGRIFGRICENKAVVAVMTPSFAKLCLINPEFNGENYPSLKCFYFCGEVLDKKTAERIFDRFRGISVINAYGPTEATSAVSAVNITYEMLSDEDGLPVGILDNTSSGITVENGEIILRGGGVSSGYINGGGGFYKENGLNCYRTGDLGYIKNGMLYFIGRKDSQIKFKGYRIELGDIEKNINKIIGVKDCAVTAKTDGNGTVCLLKAFIVADDSTDIGFIKEELSKSLPYYMIPKVIKKLEYLPINKNGKTDRRMLADL